MVLQFENKTYESLWQRIQFSIFKYGYVAHKYQFIYKILYVFETIFELFILIFLLSVNVKDLFSDDIRQFGNMYTSNYDQTKFSYSNYDQPMSFFINFIDCINKLSRDSVIFILVFILCFFLLKYSEFIYFMIPKVSVINPTGFKKILFYIYSFQDQLLKTFGDLVTIALTLSVYQCTNDYNIFYSTDCFVGKHLAMAILAAFILFLFFFYEVIQCFFYDPCNLVSNDNFGLSNNIYSDILFFLGKTFIVIFDLFDLIDADQEIIKISVFFGVCLVCLYFIFDHQCKFHNFYQNAIIFMFGFIMTYTFIVFLYVIFKTKITLFIFILSLFSSLLIGVLIVIGFSKAKTEYLYTREQDLESYHNIIHVVEMILRYSSNKIYKIIINGFIQCFNIEYDEEMEKCKEIDGVIAINKQTPIELGNNLKRREMIQPHNVKYLLTISNMLIIGSVREVLSKANKKKEVNDHKTFKQIKLLDFVSQIVNKYSIKSHQFSFNFKLLTAQIYLKKLNNYTRAWFILSNFYETFNKFSTKQQFYIFSMYQELHDTLQKEDEESIHKKSKVKKIIKMDKSKAKFIKKICHCTSEIKLFWINFMNEKQKGRLSKASISESLKKINKKYEKLQIFFTHIQKLYEDNSGIFYIYCCFLKNIMNNVQLSDHIIKLLKDFKDNHLTSAFIDDDYYKMINIEQLGLLLVSCNNLEIGKIRWANKKISTWLGFGQSDLAKLKINRIIPPVIAAKHNEFMKSFIQSNVEFLINVTRVSVFINSDDYLFPIIMYMNIFPRIKNGIELSVILSLVTDNTFLLYKNPEIKIDTKLCLVLFNEDGSIEAVDKNANTFLGIPNLVRNGWKTKITIDKRKCNLFELSPGLKRFLDENKETVPHVNNANENSANPFINECELDTTILTEEFYNDEYGLFLSINNRISYMISKGININNWPGNKDYYEVEKQEYSHGDVSSRLKYEYQNSIVPNIFKCHLLAHEIYQFNSPQHQLHLYLIKYYFPLDSFINMRERGGDDEKKNTTTLLTSNNTLTGTGTGFNHPCALPNTRLNSSSMNYREFFKKDTIRKDDISKCDSSNIVSGSNFLKKRNQSAVNDIAKKRTRIRSISKLSDMKNTEGTTLKQSNLNKTTYITNERLRLKKEIMIQEKITNQSSSYQIIQLLFVVIIISLIIIISIELYFKLRLNDYLYPLSELMFYITCRRESTTHLIINVLLHIENSNDITNFSNFPQYNLSGDSLYAILQEDINRIKGDHNKILDFYSLIKERSVYDSYSTEYYEYDSSYKKKVTIMLIDTVYDLFIANFDKYFELKDFEIENKERYLSLFNFFKNESNSLELTDTETRLVNILSNGLNLITLSDAVLTKVLKKHIAANAEKDNRIMLIINVLAICFIVIFSFSVLILFLRLYNRQDEVFKTFALIDFTCSIKVCVMADKFLKVLSNLNEEKYNHLKAFYLLDHNKLYILVNALLSSEKKITANVVQGNNNKATTLFFKDTNQQENGNPKESSKNFGNPEYNNLKMQSDSNFSSDSMLSNQNNYNNKNKSSTQSVSFVSKKNHDEDLIMRYKRYSEDKRKKADREETKIIKQKSLFINSFFFCLLFIILLCCFFAIVIVLDYQLKDFVVIALDFFAFHEQRGYFSVNDLIFFKLLIITATTSQLDPLALMRTKEYLNKTIENEEKIQSFIINKHYLDFDLNIQEVDIGSVCAYYLANSSIPLSNNITKLNGAICTNENTYTEVINKPLTEVILYLTNFIRDRLNSFDKESVKSSSVILQYIGEKTMVFVLILSQFVIRQSIFLIVTMIEEDFTGRLNIHYNIGISLYIVFFIMLIVIVFLANFGAFLVFNKKKTRNELLINLIPDEFLVKQLEEEEEEKERKKEMD